MPVTITGSSTGLTPGVFSSGTVIQSAFGYNNTTGTKVFSSDTSPYEEVPGQLRAVITPTTVGNKMIVTAHLQWGGNNGTSNDICALFRVYKSTDNGSTWTAVGTYPTANASYPLSNCATGWYTYYWGDGNSTSFDDHLLVHETITSTSQTIYAVHWASGYSANGGRTHYWNRSNNWGNDYNMAHLCTIQAYEVKA